MTKHYTNETVPPCEKAEDGQHEWEEWEYPLGHYRGMMDRTCRVCDVKETIDSTG